MIEFELAKGDRRDVYIYIEIYILMRVLVVLLIFSQLWMSVVGGECGEWSEGRTSEEDWREMGGKQQ